MTSLSKRQVLSGLSGLAITGLSGLGGAVVMTFLPDAIPEASRQLYSRIGVGIGLAIMLAAFLPPLVRGLPQIIYRAGAWIRRLRVRNPFYAKPENQLGDEPGDGSSNEAPIKKSEPLVNIDSMERLREIYRPCRHAFVYAYEHFIADIQLRAEASSDRAKMLLFQNVQRYDIGDFYQHCEAVRAQMEVQQPTQKDFQNLLSSFKALTKKYHGILGWLREAGNMLFENDEYLASSGYRELYERHQKYVAALESIKGRQDIGIVAHYVKRFNDLLPDQPITPPVPDPSEPPNV